MPRCSHWIARGEVSWPAYEFQHGYSSSTRTSTGRQADRAVPSGEEAEGSVDSMQQSVNVDSWPPLLGHARSPRTGRGEQAVSTKLEPHAMLINIYIYINELYQKVLEPSPQSAVE